MKCFLDFKSIPVSMNQSFVVDSLWPNDTVYRQRCSATMAQVMVILFQISIFSFNKMYMTILSAKWQPFCYTLKCSYNTISMPNIRVNKGQPRNQSNISCLLWIFWIKLATVFLCIRFKFMIFCNPKHVFYAHIATRCVIVIHQWKISIIWQGLSCWQQRACSKPKSRQNKL